VLEAKDTLYERLKKLYPSEGVRVARGEIHRLLRCGCVVAVDEGEISGQDSAHTLAAGVRVTWLRRTHL